MTVQRLWFYSLLDQAAIANSQLLSFRTSKWARNRGCMRDGKALRASIQRRLSISASFSSKHSLESLPLLFPGLLRCFPHQDRQLASLPREIEINLRAVKIFKVCLAEKGGVQERMQQSRLFSPTPLLEKLSRFVLSIFQQQSKCLSFCCALA